MLRIAHTSDWHIGKYLKGAKDITRRNVFIAINNFIDDCIAKEVDIVLIAGDLYDYSSPDHFSLNQSAYLLKKLKDHGIQTFAIRGNHDVSKDPDREAHNTLDTINLFDAITYVNDECVILDDYPEPVAIYGLGYQDSFDYSSIELLLEEEKISQNRFNILMLHQSVAGMEGSDNRSWVESLGSILHVDTLSSYGFDYIALGHHHNFKEIQKYDTTIVYSGSIEHWNSSNWAEFDHLTDQKNWVLLEIENNTLTTSVQSIPVSKKLRKKLDYSEWTDINAVIDDIKQELVRANAAVGEGILAFYIDLPFKRADQNFPFQNLENLVPDVLYKCSKIIFNEPHGRTFELINSTEETILKDFIDHKFPENSEYWYGLLGSIFSKGRKLPEEEMAEEFLQILEEYQNEA